MGRSASSQARASPPLVTPDGRYVVIAGVLLRRANPLLPMRVRIEWTDKLVAARRAARLSRNPVERAAARRAMAIAKEALGEAGAVWWEDGADDFSRRAPSDTPYAEWWAGLPLRLRRG